MNGAGENTILNDDLCYMNYIICMIKLNGEAIRKVLSQPLVVRDREGFSNHRVFIWEGNGLFMTNTL